MRNTYAKTMAHELGHGLFGLDHPFIKSYGIPKGETNNLMDYTTKTPDDFLSYHEWAQIDQPVASWSLFNSDEGNMDYWDDLCAWFKGLFVKENQDELETKVGAISQLLRDVYNNYDKYYESISYDKSKKQNNTTDLNITLKGFEEWSVRGFSRSDKVCKSIYNKIISKKQEDISLHEKGIFLETYKFNSDRVTKEYKIAIYSLKQKFSITKNLIKINEKKQLTDNNYIKVGCNKKYGLLAFYDENGALQMIIQMWNTNTANPSPEEDVISWLNYLSIITSDIPSEESTSSGVWESISESIQETKKKATESLESLKSYVGEILSSIELPIFWEGGENSENKTDVIQPTGHYIVSVSDATIRKNDDRSKFENSNIPIGTEVVVESEESVDGVIVAHVKLVGSNPEQYYYTTKSNLTPIVPFDNNGETVKFRAKKKSVVLPYSSISTNKEHKVGFECNIVAKCGIYYRIYSSTLSDNGQSEENSKGFWVRGRDLSIRG